MNRTDTKHVTHVLELNMTIPGRPAGNDTRLPSTLASSKRGATERAVAPAVAPDDLGVTASGDEDDATAIATAATAATTRAAAARIRTRWFIGRRMS
jgi:hypothetical protein